MTTPNFYPHPMYAVASPTGPMGGGGMYTPPGFMPSLNYPPPTNVIPPNANNNINFNTSNNNNLTRTSIPSNFPSNNNNTTTTTTSTVVESTKESQPISLKAPEPDKWILEIPETISLIDMELIKLTAQFVAKNGKNVELGLIDREQRNQKYDFLKPMHHLHSYYQKLVASYSLILSTFSTNTHQYKPSDGSDNNINNEKYNNDVIMKLTSVNKTLLIQKLLHNRVEWERQQRILAEQEDLEAKEREERNAVDWHDFIVVETIDFPDPPPPSAATPAPSSSASVDDASSLMNIDDNDEAFKLAEQEFLKKKKEAASLASAAFRNALQHVKMDIDDSNKISVIGTDNSSTAASMVNDDEDDEDELNNVVIRPNPLPSGTASSTSSSGKFMRCPKCDQLIPEEEFTNHMKIELLDRHAREARKRQQLTTQAARDTTLAEGQQVEKNLRNLARQRSDVFITSSSAAGGGSGGTSAELEEQLKKKKDALIWDGHSSSIARTTNAAIANMPLQMAVNELNAEPTIGPTLPNNSVQQQQQPPLPNSSVMITANNNRVLINNNNLNPNGVAAASSGVVNPPMPGYPPFVPPHMMPGMVMYSPPVNMHTGMPMPPHPYATAPPTITPQQPPLPPSSSNNVTPPLPNNNTQQQPPLPSSDELPNPKRQKLTTSNAMDADENNAAGGLISEQEWIQRQGGPQTVITVKVQVPSSTTASSASSAEISKWKFNGQVLQFSLAINATFKDLKNLIRQELGGMPLGKQKLKISATDRFVKDMESLAVHNLKDGALIDLGVKARGGRGGK